MFDLKRTYYSDVKDRNVASGAVIEYEGRALIGALESGVEVASYSAGGSTSERFIGFSLNTSIVDDQAAFIETVIVGTASPLSVNLSHGNLVASSIRVYNVTEAAAYSAGDPTMTATAFSINTTTGVLTVGANGSGDTFTVSYRYTLTAKEQQIVRRQRPVNAAATTLFGQVGVIRGQGEIYTDQWDTSLDWSSATNVYTAANGLLSTNSAGTLVGRVISIPSAADPFLGVAFITA